jgi:hypothetical protein
MVRMRKQGEARKGSENVYFGVRIDADLIELLKQRARQDDRTIGGELNYILRKTLQEQRKGGRP